MLSKKTKIIKMSSTIIATKPVYNQRQDQVRFGFVLSKVLIDYTNTKKIPHKTSYYRLLTTLRKKLKIPGKSYERIDQELRKTFPLIPDFLFESKTKDERVKIYKNYVETAKLPE